MRLRYLVNFIGLCIVVVSCNTYDLPAGTPKSIEKLIADYPHDNDCLQVERYNMAGIKYFKFVDNCVNDYGYDYFDEDGTKVCNTNGGWGPSPSLDCSINPGDLVLEEIIWPR